jgi:hypothetical protein
MPRRLGWRCQPLAHRLPSRRAHQTAHQAAHQTGHQTPGRPQSLRRVGSPWRRGRPPRPAKR